MCQRTADHAHIQLNKIASSRVMTWLGTSSQKQFRGLGFAGFVGLVVDSKSQCCACTWQARPRVPRSGVREMTASLPGLFLYIRAILIQTVVIN